MTWLKAVANKDNSHSPVDIPERKQEPIKEEKPIAEQKPIIKTMKDALDVNNAIEVRERVRALRDSLNAILGEK